MSEIKLPVRKHVRMQGFDYSLEGCYFVTVVTQNRWCLFGLIQDDVMHLNDVGNMIKEVVSELPNRYPGVMLPAYVIMPNHIHFVVRLPGNVKLNKVVAEFKGYTTHLYSEMVKKGARKYDGRFWQRNYYEHIIRNPRAFDYIINYIATNPQRWNKDVVNPDHGSDVDEIMKNVLDIQ